MKELNEVVIVDFLRTPMSRSSTHTPEKDIFLNYRADELLGMVIKKLIERVGINPSLIDDMITGCAFPVGENWLYGGRNPLFLSELPYTIPAMAIDRQCASSMSSVHIGTMEIMTGNADIILACGMEHMTRVPMDFTKNTAVVLNEDLIDYKNHPEYKKYDLKTGFSMIQTAQKLHEISGITREEMDEWALRSHNKAIAALDGGFFNDEILPIEVKQNEKQIKLVEYDQSIRRNSKLEIMKKLRPVSKGITQDPQITAGNSSPLNAGAGAAILMSKKKAIELGLSPLAKIVSMSWAAVDPSIMGTGPVPASQKALKRANLRVDDIDYWEINEAFAVVALNTIKELTINPEKVNVKGGAIALGHALGLTGVRLVSTLARILQKEGGTYGLATPCVGGGQGTATILERL
ncbi:MAG: acetyl-CoA C-acetyltransferase [Candidatus Lokiarchaeota archaeon]|nr:acetyl-CoA C-acetyltransferase [Candidatus Lokiarchaeota archaeon]